MFLISNRQHDEIIEMLTEYVKCDSGAASGLRERNRYRRARLLIEALSKRMQIDSEKLTLLTTPKNK